MRAPPRGRSKCMSQELQPQGTARRADSLRRQDDSNPSVILIKSVWVVDQEFVNMAQLLHATLGLLSSLQGFGKDFMGGEGRSIVLGGYCS